MEYKDWKLDDSIGEGGQAHVYLATRKDDDNLYALKRFKNPKREERSKSEILNMKSIRSLGIKAPEIIDSGNYKEGRPYFVTKYYKNKSLEFEISNGCTNIERIAFTQRLCVEIRKMNLAGFVHRDLKPANILLDDDWNPVIADFGLTQDTDEITGYTKTGEPIGSNHYMHPQAFETKKIETNFHMGFDGYSFGKMLYFLLADSQLFGFEMIKNPDEFSSFIEDPYIRTKMTRGINKLLSHSLTEVVPYWGKFPSELKNLLAPAFKPKNIDEASAERLKLIYMNRLNGEEKADVSTVDPDDIKHEIINMIKQCEPLKFIDKLMEEVGEASRVKIEENVNLREILEGVGVKSNYGIDPLRPYGRKQSLVKLELMISPPNDHRHIGISIISNTPSTIILLCVIEKNEKWVDIDQNQILKLTVDDNELIEKSYLKQIDDYILNLLKTE